MTLVQKVSQMERKAATPHPIISFPVQSTQNNFVRTHIKDKTRLNKKFCHTVVVIERKAEPPPHITPNT